MTTKPYPYQRDGYVSLEKFQGRSLLAWDMGMGKCLGSLLYAKRNLEVRPIIVVCPASIKWQWQQEASHHIGMRSQVLESHKVPTSTDINVPMVIINYDILHSWVDWLRKLNPQLIILDECQFTQDLRSKRTRACMRLCGGIPHILALTGTPILSRPIQMWPMLNILRPELFPSYWAFAHKYCDPKHNRFGWQFNGSTNSKELRKMLLKNVMIRKRKADVIEDLPPKIRTIIPLDLSNRDEYKQALGDFLGWLRTKDPSKLRGAIKSQGLVKLGYMLRLAAKLKMPMVHQWMKDFFKQNEGKLLAFAIHKNIVHELHDKWKGSSVVVDGGVIGKDRHLAVQKFQTNKKIRLFVGNIKAAGIGLNLSAAETVGIVELPWTPAALVQAEDRAIRVNNLHKVNVYYFVARGTIEEELLKLLWKKQKMANEILDGEGKGDVLDLFSELVKSISQNNTLSNGKGRKKC